MAVDTFADAAHSSQIGTTVTLNSGANFVIDNASEYVALQFDSVTVQQGETITSATLDVDSVDNDGGIITTAGDDSDDAAVLTSATNDISSRTTTTATVDTTMNSFGVESIDVTSIIQEIVNRGSWSYENRIVLVLEGNPPSNDDAELDLGSANMELRIDHPLGPPAAPDITRRLTMDAGFPNNMHGGFQ